MDEVVNGTMDLRDRLIDLLGIHEGTKVLDIGCGPGMFEMIFGSTGAELFAIDYSQGMVDEAVSNTGRMGIVADIRRMNAQELEFEDEMFDVIVSRDVFWSLVDPEATYREIVRVMKPGAKAFIIDGNYYLGLFDENYRYKPPKTPQVQKKEPVGSHYKFHDGKVDFKVMDELAKDLPLSRQKRPQWDVQILCDLPCSDINVRMRAHPQEDGLPRRIGRFEITFTKECDSFGKNRSRTNGGELS